MSWFVNTLSHLDPQITEFNCEVLRIFDLPNIAYSMSDVFSDIAKVTKSHIPVENMPVSIDVPLTSMVPPRGVRHCVIALDGGIVMHKVA